METGNGECGDDSNGSIPSASSAKNGWDTSKDPLLACAVEIDALMRGAILASVSKTWAKVWPLLSLLYPTILFYRRSLHASCVLVLTSMSSMGQGHRLLQPHFGHHLCASRKGSARISFLHNIGTANINQNTWPHPSLSSLLYAFPVFLLRLIV